MRLEGQKHRASTTIEAGNDALRSRAAITDSVHRYARNISDGYAGASGALFTHDIAFVVRAMDRRQLEQVAER